MAGITLDQAETQLSDALTALSAARKAYSVTVGDKSAQFQKIESLQKDVEYWDMQVKRLSRTGGGIRVVGITPSDS